MSIHRSLRAAERMKRHRSVLTRLERLKVLLGKGAWREGQSPLGLPKVKHVKVTVKKEKAAAPAAGAEAPAGAAATPAPGAKPAAGAAAPAKAAAAPAKSEKADKKSR